MMDLFLTGNLFQRIEKHNLTLACYIYNESLTIKIFIVLFIHAGIFVMIVIWSIYGYFQWPFRVCAYYRTKETCLVNVHYSSCDIISYSMAGAQWRLLGWNTSLCFNGYSKSLFVLVYLLNVQQSFILGFWCPKGLHWELLFIEGFWLLSEERGGFQTQKANTHI